MNFYALSTPPGISGIAVVRVSGSGALQIGNQITRTVIDKPRSALLKSFYDQKGDLIDEGILIWYPEGQSYTGDHLIEIHTHGSKAVINKILDDLEDRKDCRLAEPGEFTKTAYLNNRINLYEAESIADLLQAETEAQRIQALRLKNSSPKFIDWRETVLDVLSKTEASIDFSEEDLPDTILKDNEKKIKLIVSEIDEMLDESMGEIIRDGYKIAIIGAPNAGKSSFLNLLIKREAAIVSSVKGTTRDIIEIKYNINNYPVILTDTAGIRKAKNKIEKIGVELALNASKEANLDLLIIDGSEKKIPRNVLKLISDKSFIVLNKTDKKNYSSKKIIKELKNYKFKDLVEISIKNKNGINKLNSKLKNLISRIDTEQSTTLISRARHRSLLKKCSERLHDYLKIKETNEIEKAAEDLRLASNSLGHIVGFIGVEEILGKIFKDFCIGK
ncbi:MAG: tRNA uridine-5-carboxymethylaminomethyl(34) synthesis GTPase MnmE [Pelagibacteraceae bacterium]|jgi:tRNA modification GTPase